MTTTFGAIAGRAAIVGVGAGLAAGCAAYHRRPLATARAILRLRLRAAGAAERTVAVSGLPVRFFEAGPRRGGDGDAEAVVLVHGFADSAETWAAVLPALARDRWVLAPDLPGFGRTPPPPEGMRFSVSIAYLDGFLDALGVGRAVLIGNSLGGAIAIRYAAGHPERVARLVLLDSAGLHGEAPTLLEPATRAVARELLEVVSGPGRRTPRFILDDVVRQARDPARRSALRSAEPVDVSADLPRIAAPTTIVWGELDRLIPLANGVRLRDGIAGAELVVLPGVGHAPQVQAPRRVVAIVRERLGPPPA